MRECDGPPLKICILSYRSNPHCGGQGVYVRNLTKALTDIGHQVEVVAGPPDPLLYEGAKLSMLDCLDLYNAENPFRTPTLKELSNPINLMEWLSVSTMGFPEPFTFGIRAYQYLRNRFQNYDVIHDNQSLSYGLLAMGKFVPTLATIHHPITVDRKLAVRSVRSFVKKVKYMRWYSFIGMQKRVSRRLDRIITVSEFSKQDISRDFKVPLDRFSVVPNGIDTQTFHPMPEVKRKKNTLIVTNSADTALKGLYYLLQAVHEISKTRKIKLTVIGTPKKNGGIENLIRTLGIDNLVTFTGRISDEDFVRQYALSSVAVVPSLYEGFGLPVGEAMACGIPVVSTTGGALPEVAGDAAILVPPGDPGALARAIVDLLENPEKAKQMGDAGYRRVLEHFTWENAARKTVAAYREVIRDHHRY